MSKPDKPGELRAVTVDAISLVSKAANGERFKIFKSAEEEVPAPEVVEKDERGLFRALKKFFVGDAVEKGAVADTYNASKAGGKLHEAFEALMKVLGLSRWEGDKQTPETDSAKIISALDDFRNIAVEVLLGKGEIEKSGRKISGDRLGKLKNIQAILNEVLSGLDEEDVKQEAEELTKEEVQKTVDEAVKAVNIEEVIKKALTPIKERIEKIENARGVSNRVQESSAVEKSSNDFWKGVFNEQQQEHDEGLNNVRRDHNRRRQRRAAESRTGEKVYQLHGRQYGLPEGCTA